MNNQEIIWLASYPKSGNTWLRFFLYSYYIGIPLNSGDINEKILDIHTNPNLENAGNGRIFCKTHLIKSPNHPSIECTAGFIYILRHPKDVLLSNLNYFLLTGHSQLDPVQFVHDFIRYKGVPYWKSLGMGSWPEHVDTWLSANNMRHLVLRYEQIRANPHEQFFRVIEYLDTEVDKKKLDKAILRSSFENLSRIENKEKKQNKYSPVFWGNPSTTQKGFRFMNKGGINQTLTQLDPALDQQFDEAFEEELHKVGYL